MDGWQERRCCVGRLKKLSLIFQFSFQCENRRTQREVISFGSFILTMLIIPDARSESRLKNHPQISDELEACLIKANKNYPRKKFLKAALSMPLTVTEDCLLKHLSHDTMQVDSRQNFSVN